VIFTCDFCFLSVLFAYFLFMAIGLALRPPYNRQVRKTNKPIKQTGLEPGKTGCAARKQEHHPASVSSKTCYQQNN